MIRIFVLIVALLCGEPTLAQGVSEETELPAVTVTAGRIEEVLLDIPQSVTALGRDQIDRQTPQTVSDLLRGLPGAFTQSSGPGQGIVIARGLKGSEILHLVDGMRLNMSFFRNSPSQYLALVDPYNIERVELLRGSGGTLYGSDALGGVLQLLTPEPRFADDIWKYRARARVSYGSADLARSSRLEAAAGVDGFSIGGGLTYLDFGSRDIGDGGRQPFTAYRANGGDGKLLWSLAPGHELMLSAQYFRYPRLPRYFEIVGGPGGAGSGLPVYFEPNDRRFVHARYRLMNGSSYLKSIELHVAQQVIDDDRSRMVEPTVVEHERNRSQLSGLTLQAVSEPGEFLRLLYGLDFYSDHVFSEKTRTELDTGEVMPRDSTFPNGSNQRSFGAYLSSEWKPASAVMMDAGLRYSGVTTDLPGTPAGPAMSLNHNDLTAHAGASIAVADGIRWTANLARGFRAPNVFDLGSLGRRPNSTPQQINVANPTLEPETIVSIDTGLKWANGRSSAELSIFAARHTDRIEPREPTGNTIANGQYGCTADDCIEVRSENIARAEYHGLEAGYSFALSGPSNIYGTLNFTWGSEVDSGQTRPANRVPPLNGQVGAVLRPRQALSVEPFLLFAARQARLDDDDLNDVRINPDGTPGWTTVNMRLDWHATPRLRFQLEGRNLLDQGYREHGSGVDGAGRGVSATVLVGFP